MTLMSRQEQVDTYYEELDDLDKDFMRVYTLYKEQFDFRDCKRYSAGGDLIGIDVSQVREILEKDYGFPPSVVTDYLRKIRVIDFVITEHINKVQNQEREVMRNAQSSSKPGGTVILPAK